MVQIAMGENQMTPVDSILESRIAKCRARLNKFTSISQRKIAAAELQKLLAQRTPAELQRVAKETYK